MDRFLRLGEPVCKVCILQHTAELFRLYPSFTCDDFYHLLHNVLPSLLVEQALWSSDGQEAQEHHRVSVECPYQIFQWCNGKHDYIHPEFECCIHGGDLEIEDCLCLIETVTEWCKVSSDSLD